MVRMTRKIERQRRNERIAREFGDGKSLANLAMENKMTVSGIRAILKSQGVELKRPMPDRGSLAHSLSLFSELLEDGLTRADRLCSQYKVSEEELKAVFEVMKDAGIVDEIVSLRRTAHAANLQDWIIAYRLLNGETSLAISEAMDVDRNRVLGIKTTLSETGVSQLFKSTAGRRTREASAESFEILGDIMSGKRNKDIAEERGITENAVSKIRTRAMNVDSLRQIYESTTESSK